MEQILLFCLVAGVYLIPSILASGKKGSSGIIALNVLLGWTFIGWVAAFIWAVTANNRPMKAFKPLDVTMCPYCEVNTRTHNSTIPLTGRKVLRCTECNGVKDFKD